MKQFLQFILFFMLFIFLFGFAACSKELEQPNISSKIQVFANEKGKETVTNKILVVYFSSTGTTKQLSEYAKDILNADIYEIVPEIPYTEADLAYYTGGRADKEQNDSTARPSISGSVQNMEQYDTVLLGYPIWHGQAQRIISTFLES